MKKITKTKNDLELSTSEFRSLVSEATDYLCDFLDGLSDSNVVFPPPDKATILGQLREDIPETAAGFHKAMVDLFDKYLPYGLENASGRNLSYFPGGGLPQAAVADMITSLINRYVTVWDLSPGLAELEMNVVRWFCKIIGYPESAIGILTSGSSLATFSAVLSARCAILGEDISRGTYYTSDISHYCINKAFIMAGLPKSALRVIPTDDDFIMRANDVRKQIQEDRANGFKPFMIVATAGATRTGSVDDLPPLSEVAEEEGLWLHVDAAYAGFFMLTERGKKVLDGINRADSIALDAHKSLFLPYGTGAILVKNKAALRSAFDDGMYRYSTVQEDHDRIDFSEYSPELSRELRGLRVWLPLKMHGMEPFRQSLDEKLDLIEWVENELVKIPDIELTSKRVLSVVTFRYFKNNCTQEKLNELNRNLLHSINAKNRVHLMGVMLRDCFVIRLCTLSFRTHFDTVERAIEDIRSEVGKLPSQQIV